MSRFDDQRTQSDPTNLERDKPSQNRTVDFGTRFGMSKEAARIEIDRFRGVAEYETRKVFGQHSTLKRAVAPEPIRPKASRKNADKHTRTTRMVADESAPQNVSAAESDQFEIFDQTPEVGE